MCQHGSPEHLHMLEANPSSTSHLLETGWDWERGLALALALEQAGGLAMGWGYLHNGAGRIPHTPCKRLHHPPDKD